MKTNTIHLAVMAALSYFMPLMGFAQNPILRSTTTSAPTSFLQVTPSAITQSGTKIGIGTTNPSQLLVLNKTSTNGAQGDTYAPAAPTLRFENKNLAGSWRYWNVSGGNEFRIYNDVTAQTPFKIDQSGNIEAMQNFAVSASPIMMTRDERLALQSSGITRRITWAAFDYNNGGDNLQIPLEFLYDAQGNGVSDVSIMKLMPSGQVRIGNINTTYQNFVLGSAPNTNSSIRLTVDGNVAAKGFIATQQNWADFVFYAPQGNPTLEQEENSIEQNCTLLGVPTETEAAQGRNLAENDALLLQKLEQLYLHVIELNKQMRQMETQLQELGRENEALKLQLDKK